VTHKQGSFPGWAHLSWTMVRPGQSPSRTSTIRPPCGDGVHRPSFLHYSVANNPSTWTDSTNSAGGKWPSGLAITDDNYSQQKRFVYSNVFRRQHFPCRFASRTQSQLDNHLRPVSKTRWEILAGRIPMNTIRGFACLARRRVWPPPVRSSFASSPSLLCPANTAPPTFSTAALGFSAATPRATSTNRQIANPARVAEVSKSELCVIIRDFGDSPQKRPLSLSRTPEK